MSAVANGWTLYAEPVRGRQCGKCQACCTIVPVELADEHKPAHQRCKHQCSRGCAIYPRRPMSCEYWSCRWLFDPDAIDVRRPDLSGYTIDPVLDKILIDGEPFEALQVWIDPKRPEAANDPKLRAYIAQIAARHGFPTIVRFSQKRSTVLFPPALTQDGEWREYGDQTPLTHEEMNEKLAAIGVARFI